MVEPETRTLTRCPIAPSKRTRPILPGLVIGTVRLAASPYDMRPVNSTSAGVNPEGGMTRSLALTAVPAGVAIVILPDVAAPGIVVAIDVVEAVDTLANAMLSNNRLFDRTVSKLVPEMVSPVNGDAMAGVKPVIVGAPVAAATVKLLLAEPSGEVTATWPTPNAAPEGTLVTICVAVDEATVAVVPLIVTVF